MSRKRFNHHDTGCQADGTFGHDHVRAVMASLWGMAMGLDSGLDPDDLLVYDSLLQPMPDDAWDELEFLKGMDLACDGVSFELDNGDLICLPTTNEEDET